MTINTFLKEDKVFTKNELINFDVNKFIEIDKIIKKTADDKCRETIEVLTEYLNEKPNSLYAAYLIGSLGMKSRPQEDNIHMQNVLLTFYDYQNYSVVEYLCNKILALNENKCALRILADYYEELGKDDLKWELYIRLVKVDYEERIICKKIADHFLSNKDILNASLYYKKLIARYINEKDHQSIELIWKTLFELNTEESSYFVGLAEKICTYVSPILASNLLDTLLIDSTDVDKKISIYKTQLFFNSNNNFIKDNLIKAYRIKYKEYPRLKECLQKANIRNATDVFRAIEYFETNTEFNKGAFVHHVSSDRIGIIQSVGSTEVEIKFGKNISKMSAEMAFKALVPLSKSHILVLKNAVPQKLEAKVKSDTRWTLVTLLESHGKKCSMKTMKSDLVPKILSESEWEVFKRSAKKILAEDPYFYQTIGLSETYELKSTPYSPEEKKLALFRAEKDFYSKVKIVRDFINNKFDIESDSFAEMLQYFNNLFKQKEITDEQISAYLFLNILKTTDNISIAVVNSELSFTQMYKKLEDKVEVFKNIELSEIKKAFINEIFLIERSWAQLLKKCFTYYTNSEIIKLLKDNNQFKIYNEILKESIVNYKDNVDVLLWNIKNTSSEDWNKAEISQNDIVLTMVSLLAHTSACIELKKDGAENRRRKEVINKFLFAEKNVYKAIDSSKIDFSYNIYSVISNDKYIDQGKLIEIKHAIGIKFPDFEFSNEEVEVVDNLIPKGFLCTKKGLDEKIAELDYMQHVELLEVAEEIAEARSHGDLRENAEYQYGKDKQKNLNAKIKTLSDEVDSAQVIYPDMIDGSKISFGTKVTLFDKLTNKNIIYFILGQWESDPSKGILNFKTPLATELLNKVVNDDIKFDINGTKYSYKVLNIEKMDF